MKIPDYYRQFQNQPAEEKTEEKTPETSETEKTKAPQQKPSAKPEAKPAAPQDKTVVFQGNGFTVNQLEEWEDKTIYTITGPVTDGIQHNVIITVDNENTIDNLQDYAEWQIKTLEEELKGCTLLKKGETELTNGAEAYEAIFSWYPLDDYRIYQHQVYTFHEKKAYKLTASFTKKTRQTIGPAIVRMMLSFNPDNK
ncbi:MAG TPA: DcrB-related protein [Ignavibacteriaceae bacterium]|nr:DcrB-related protein [Ignavibacteriaceae bacterium]